MYCLKRIAIAEGSFRDTDAPALAKTFTDLVERYGRSFELGLASRFYLFHKPLAMLKMGPLGWSMLTRGRMALVPTKIRRVEQLQAIVKKAREIGGKS
jgi:heterodisulfide reductase subunit C/quinone-modifying oxidoreductase subunit QmoC